MKSAPRTKTVIGAGSLGADYGQSQFALRRKKGVSSKLTLNQLEYFKQNGALHLSKKRAIGMLKMAFDRIDELERKLQYFMQHEV